MNEAPPDPVGRRPSAWGLVFDVGATIVFTVGTVIGRQLDDAPPVWVALIAWAAAVAVIWVRRRAPWSTFTGAVALSSLLLIGDARPNALAPAVLVAVYTVARWHPLRQAIAAGAVSTLLFAAMAFAVYDGSSAQGGGVLAAIAWPGFAVATGAALRSAALRADLADERARRAEAEAEQVAARRVAEERLSIARDVHDLVAHQLAVVSVQTGVAGHLLDADPPAAAAALDTARAAASDAVDELGALLSVLRHDGDAVEPAGLGPTPGVADVAELLQRFEFSGSAATYTLSGPVADVPPAVGVAAYRVVQEATTNAHKHGSGAPTIEVRVDDGRVRVRVSNPVNTVGERGSAPTLGYGLVGMRERVEAVGGTLAVDRARDRFTIEATMPWERR